MSIASASHWIRVIEARERADEVAILPYPGTDAGSIVILMAALRLELRALAIQLEGPEC